MLDKWLWLLSNWHNNRKFLFLILFVMGFLTLIFLIKKTSPITTQAQLQVILKSKVGCKVPCWQGLVPSISTENDFLSIVDTFPESMFDDLRRNPLSPKGVQYIWTDNTTSITSYIEIYTKTIAFISFNPEQDLTLKSIFEELGIPNEYIAELFIGEAYLFDLYLFYQNEGVVIHIQEVPFDPPNSAFVPVCEVSLTSNTAIKEIYFVKPNTANRIMDRLAMVIGFSGKTQPWIDLDTIELASCPK